MGIDNLSFLFIFPFFLNFGGKVAHLSCRGPYLMRTTPVEEGIRAGEGKPPRASSGDLNTLAIFLPLPGGHPFDILWDRRWMTLTPRLELDAHSNIVMVQSG
uniref:Uncharacterized protein n=1 Tax=Opuntia streptacantha TaxID=393608 RepID=A0A7C8ZPD7_OPUST